MNVLEYLKKSPSWFRISFTYGNAVETTTDVLCDSKDLSSCGGGHLEKVEDTRYDGMISAIQLFILVIAASSATTFAVHTSTRFDYNACLWTLIVSMIIGITIMSVLSCYRNSVLVSRTEVAEEDTEEEEEEQGRDNLTLIGIGIFFVLGCLHDLFLIIASVSCDEVWRVCTDRYIYVSYVIQVIYHIVRIAYFGTETLFCISFNRSTFSRKPLTQYGLMFVQAVNFSLWFDAFVHESSHMFSIRPRASSFYSRCLADRINVTDVQFKCANHNSTIYNILHNSISPAFIPFTIEFTLLAGECFSHWYFHSLTTSSDPRSCRRHVVPSNVNTYVEDPVEGNDCDEVAQLEHKSDNYLDMSENSLISEYSDSFSSDFTDSHADPVEPLSLPEESVAPTRSSQTSIIASSACIFAVLALNLPLLVLSICRKYAMKSETQNRYTKAYFYYLFAFWSLMVAAIIVGYQVSSGFRLRTKTFSVLDYLLLFASSGPLVVTMLTFISIGELRRTMNEATFQERFTFSSGFFVAFEVVNILQVYFQVVYTLFSGRVVLERSDASYRAMVFRCVALMMAVSNLLLWMVGNINDVPIEGVTLHPYFSGVGWICIKNIAMFLPVSLFFRFVSCLQFFKVYVRSLSHEGSPLQLHNINASG